MLPRRALSVYTASLLLAAVLWLPAPRKCGGGNTPAQETASGLVNNNYRSADETGPIDGPDDEADQTIDIGGFDFPVDEAIKIQVDTSIKLRDHKKNRWGAKLKIPVETWFYAFKFLQALDEQGDELEFEKEWVQSLAIVPQLKFPIRMSGSWYLSPYQEFGAAFNYPTYDKTWISKSGVSSHVPLYYEEWVFGIGNSLNYGITWPERSEQPDDDWASFGTSLQARIPVFRKLGKYEPHTYFYFKMNYYFDDLEFGVPEGTPASIKEEYEVGTQLGTEPRIRIFKIIKIPRITIAYRFGSDVEAIKIRLGG